jgi:hypothetical protein
MSLVHPSRQGAITKLKPTRNATSYINTTSEAALLLVGTDAGIVDLSKNNRTLTIVSGITTSTTSTAYRPVAIDLAATAYGYFAGTSGSADFNFGTGDFTWETWVNYKVTNVNCWLVSSWRFGGASGFAFQVADNRIDSYLPSSLINQTVSPSLALNTWHHIAVARKSGVTSWYANGTRFATAAQTANGGVPYNVSIASDDDGPARDANLLFSDLRLVKGVALYQGPSYDVPTAALTTSSLQIQVTEPTTLYGVNQLT